jgi:PKD repeat protein
MKSLHASTKIIIRLIALSAVLFPLFLLTNCNKGSVKIYNIIDTVENCKVPYIVSFYPDAEYGPGDVSYEWSFGDGTTANERTPVHVYEETGIYNVILTITNKEVRESKSISLDLSSESLPVVPYFEMEATGKYAWAPVEMNFFNESERATSYYWEFGDGYSSTLKNPQHVFLEQGDHNITLGAICSGDTAFQTRELTVLPPPSEIYIDEVAVWLPNSFLGANLYCVAYYDIFTIEESPTAVGISSFPVVFPIREDIFHFHGDYDDAYLTFEVWEEGNFNEPVYIFDIPMYAIQDQFYPNMLVWENNSYAAEVYLDYAP